MFSLIPNHFIAVTMQFSTAGSCDIWITSVSLKVSSTSRSRNDRGRFLTAVTKMYHPYDLWGRPTVLKNYI
jgi:hypothetical protein